MSARRRTPRPFLPKHGERVKQLVDAGYTVRAAHNQLEVEFDDAPSLQCVYDHTRGLAQEHRRQSGPSNAATQRLWRLEESEKKLVEVMQTLGPINRPEIELSVQQARVHTSRALNWVRDAITCVKVDNGIELDD